MNHSKELRLNSYVRGFFPKDYFIEVEILSECDEIAPRVTINVIPSIEAEISFHTAYLHEILDISYMRQVATWLLRATDNREARQA